MKAMILLALPLLGVELVIGAVLFGSAGRLNLPWYWALLAVHAPLMVVGAASMDRSLMRERLRPGPGARDRGYRAALTAIILAQLVVAGMDAGRFRWSPALPDAIRAAALACYALGFLLSLWAMTANRFFSSVVRVQTDRGHHVVRHGPYRFVRHPGYLGMLVAVVSQSFVLGSLWSLLPLMAFALVLVSRTALEDRMLCRELTGYEEYARAVTCRLAPGIW